MCEIDPNLNREIVSILTSSDVLEDSLIIKVCNQVMKKLCIIQKENFKWNFDLFDYIFNYPAI